MSIETLCPNCGYRNLLYIDELMGKYALCEHCRALYKFQVANVSDAEKKPGQEKDNSLISGQSGSE